MKKWKITGAIFIFLLIAAIAGWGAFTTLVHFETGGGTLTVESGGKIDVKSGGELEIDSGATADINRIDAADVVATDSVYAATFKGTTISGTTGNITRINVNDVVAADSIYAALVKPTQLVIPVTWGAGTIRIGADTLYFYTGSAWKILVQATN